LKTGHLPEVDAMIAEEGEKVNKIYELSESFNMSIENATKLYEEKYKNKPNISGNLLFKTINSSEVIAKIDMSLGQKCEVSREEILNEGNKILEILYIFSAEMNSVTLLAILNRQNSLHIARFDVHSTRILNLDIWVSSERQMEIKIYIGYKNDLILKFYFSVPLREWYQIIKKMQEKRIFLSLFFLKDLFGQDLNFEEFIKR
jgi:hypothetical protein